MNPEDRLRDAIKTYTDQVEPAPDAWTRIREQVDAREIRRRRFGGWQLGFACAAAAAIVVVGIVVGVSVLRGGGGGGEPVPATGGGPRLPPRIVAVSKDKVVVLASRDGHVVRTLARGADQGTTVAVTPDGKRVFFDRQGGRARGCLNREIVSVPTRGGRARVEASTASNPAISRDGTRLAYVSYEGSNDCKAPHSLIVKSLTEPSGPITVWTVPEPGQVVLNPAWAPDSRHVAFGFIDRAVPLGDMRVLDTGAPSDAQALVTAPQVPQPASIGFPSYFGGLDAFLGAEGQKAVVVDAQTGAVVRVLFEVPRGRIGRLESDLLGDHVLAHVSLRMPTRTDSGTRLVRWSNGQSKAVKVADGLFAAVWVPDRTRAAEGAP